VLEDKATLSELSGPGASYSLADIHKANALLDMQADMQAEQQRKERHT